MIILIISLLYSYNILAKDKPLYEYGLASAVIKVPDYPASDEYTTHSLALPSFVYRGSIFRSDEKGNRAVLLSSKKINIDLSIGASFPAKSKNNIARAGMSDLDWLGELGPRLNYNLLKEKNLKIEFEMPLRYVFSTDFEFTKHQGYRLQPQIDFNYFINKNFELLYSFRLNYSSEVLSDYFYEVSGEDITPKREEYNAKEGYLGQGQSFSLIYRQSHFTMITGLRLNQYHDSANENSPLFKTKNSQNSYIAFNYFFYQSDDFAQD